MQVMRNIQCADESEWQPRLRRNGKTVEKPIRIFYAFNFHNRNQLKWNKIVRFDLIHWDRRLQMEFLIFRQFVDSEMQSRMRTILWCTEMHKRKMLETTTIIEWQETKLRCHGMPCSRLPILTCPLHRKYSFRFLGNYYNGQRCVDWCPGTWMQTV